MANNTIKTYSIEIEAITSKANAQIEALEKELNKLGEGKGNAQLKARIDALGEMINGLKGEVASSAQAMNTEFAKINTDKLSSEFKDMQRSIEGSISGLQQDLGKLEEATKFLKTGDFSGFTDGISKSFGELSENISKVLGDFKDVSETIRNIKIGAIDVDGLISDSSVKNNKKKTKELSDSTQKLVNDLTTNLNELKKIKNRKNNNLSQILDLDVTGDFDVTLATKQIKSLVTNIIKSVDKLEKIPTVDLTNIFKGISYDEILDIDEELKSQVQEVHKKVKNSMPKNIDTDIRFRIKLDEDVEGSATVTSIVDKVNEVVHNAQKEIDTIYIKTGLISDLSGFGLTKEEREKLEKASENDKLVKAVKIKTKVDADNLKKNIESTVNKLNNEFKAPAAPKIEVEVVGKINEESVEDSMRHLAYELEDAQYQNSKSVRVDGGRLTLDSASGIASENTLKDIKGILSQWNSTGIPGTQTKEFKELLNKQENNQKYINDFDKYFRSRFRNTHISKESENINNATADFLKQYRANFATKAELNKLIKSAVFRKGGEKGLEYLTSSDYYNKSFVFEGKEYANFAPGKMLLTEWQTYLKDLFAESFDPNGRRSFWDQKTKLVPAYAKDLDENGNKQYLKYLRDEEGKYVYAKDKHGQDLQDEEGNKIKATVAVRQDVIDKALKEGEVIEDLVMEEIKVTSALKDRRKGINDTNKRLRENLKLNGIEFKKEMRPQKDGTYKWTGSYTDEILNEKGTITSNEDVYAKAKNSISEIKEAAREEYQYQVNKKAILEEQRSVMQQIYFLEEKLHSEGQLEKDEVAELDNLKKRLEPFAINRLHDDDRIIYNELEARKVELSDKLKSNKGLTADELLEFSEIDGKMDDLFKHAQDLSEYIVEQLTVIPETGMSLIDTQISQTEIEIQSLIKSTRDEMQNAAAYFDQYWQQNVIESRADGSLDKSLAKKNRKIRDYYDNMFESDVVKTQAHYDWNDKEIKRLQKDNAYYLQFVGQDAKGQTDYSALSKADQDIYFRNVERIKILQKHNEIYREQNDLVENLAQTTQKVYDNERRITHAGLNAISESDKIGYEKLLGRKANLEAIATEEKRKNNKGAKAVHLTNEQFLRELTDDELKEALLSVKTLSNALDVNGAMVEQEVKSLVGQKLNEYVKHLKDSLDKEEKELIDLEKKGASKKERDRKQERIDYLTAAIDQVENPRATYAEDLEKERQILREINQEQDEQINQLKSKTKLTKEQIDDVVELWKLEKKLSEEESKLKNMNVEAWQHYTVNEGKMESKLHEADSIGWDQKLNSWEVEEMTDELNKQVQAYLSARHAAAEYRSEMQALRPDNLKLANNATLTPQAMEKLLEVEERRKSSMDKIFDIQARSHGYTGDPETVHGHKGFVQDFLGVNKVGGKSFDPFDTSLDAIDPYTRKVEILTESITNQSKTAANTVHTMLSDIQRIIQGRERDNEKLIEQHDIQKKIVQERQKEINMSENKQKAQNVDSYDATIAEKNANVATIENEIKELEAKSKELQNDIDKTSSESEHAFIDLRKEEEKVLKERLDIAKKLQANDAKIKFNQELLETKETKLSSQSDEEYRVRISEKINRLEEDKIRLQEEYNSQVQKEKDKLDEIAKKREHLISIYGENVYSSSMDDIDKKLNEKLSSQSNAYLLKEDKIHQAQTKRAEHLAKEQNKVDALKAEPVYNTRQQALVGLEKEINALKEENVKLTQEEDVLLKSITDSEASRQLMLDVYEKRFKRDQQIQLKQTELDNSLPSYQMYVEITRELNHLKEQNVTLTQHEAELLDRTVNSSRKRTLTEENTKKQEKRSNEISNKQAELDTLLSDNDYKVYVELETELEELRYTNLQLKKEEDELLNNISDAEQKNNASQEVAIKREQREAAITSKQAQRDAMLLKNNYEARVQIERDLNALKSENIELTQKENVLLSKIGNSKEQAVLAEEIAFKRAERSSKIHEKEIDLQVAERSNSKYKQENARIVLDLEEKIKAAKEEDVILTKQENHALEKVASNTKEREKLEAEIEAKRSERRSTIVQSEKELQIAQRYGTKYQDPNKAKIAQAESELNDLQEKYSELTAIEERRIQQINFETETQLELEKELVELRQKKLAVDSQTGEAQVRLNAAKSELKLEQKAKEAAEARLKTNKEIRTFQKGMSIDQKKASLGVDLQLLTLNEIQAEMRTLDTASQRYKELSTNLYNAHQELRQFRKDSQALGLTLSETTGRMYLGDANKDVSLFGIQERKFVENFEPTKYQVPGTTSEQIEAEKRFNDAKYRQYEHHSQVVEKMKEEQREMDRLQKMWRIAGMSDEQAEVSIEIQRTVNKVKDWNKATEQQKQELQALYDKAVALGLELKQNKATGKTYVKELVGHQDFVHNPEQYATNKYLRGMLLNPSMQSPDLNYVENYRGATESTLQNIQSILMTGVKVKVLGDKTKLSYKGLNRRVNKDADKPGYIPAEPYNYQNKGKWSKEDLSEKDRKSYKDWNKLIAQAKSEEEKNQYRTQALQTGYFALNKNKNVVSLGGKKNKHLTNEETIAATKEYIKEQKLAIKVEDLFAGKLKQTSKELDNKSKKTKEAKKNVKVEKGSNNFLTLTSTLNKKDASKEEKQKALDELLSQGYQLGQHTSKGLQGRYFAGKTDKTSIDITKAYAEANGLAIKSLDELQAKEKETTNVVETEIQNVTIAVQEEAKKQEKAIQYTAKQLNSYINRSKTDEGKNKWRDIAKTQGFDLDDNLSVVEEEQISMSDEQVRQLVQSVVALQEKVQSLSQQVETAKAEGKDASTIESELHETHALLSQVQAMMPADTNVIGKQVSEELADGMKDTKQVEDAAKNLADTVEETVKNELGINSPSTVFQEIAHWCGEGFKVGLDKEGKVIYGKVDEWKDKLLEKFKDGKISMTDLIAFKDSHDFDGRSSITKAVNDIINNTSLPDSYKSENILSLAKAKEMVKASGLKVNDDDLKSLGKKVERQWQIAEDAVKEYIAKKKEALSSGTGSAQSTSKKKTPWNFDINTASYKTLVNKYQEGTNAFKGNDIEAITEWNRVLPQIKARIDEIVEEKRNEYHVTEEITDEERESVETLAEKIGMIGELDISKKRTINNETLDQKISYSVKDKEGNTATFDEFGDGGLMLRQSSIVEKQATELKKLMNQVNGILNDSTVQNIHNFMPELASDAEAKKIRELSDAYKILDDTLTAFNDGTKNDFSSDELDNLYAQIKIIKDVKQSFAGGAVDLGQISSGEAKNLQTTLRNLAKSTEEAALRNIQFGKANREMTYQIKTSDKMLNTYKITVDDTGRAFKELVKSEKYLNPLQQGLHTVGKKFGEVWRYMIASTSIYEVFNFLRQGISVVQEFDKAMTELYKVAQDSTEALEAFGKEAYNIASAIGSTGVEIINSAADWSKLGYAIDEASELAKNSALYANVGDMDIDTATEHMVSTLKAFNVEAKDSISLVDKFNHVGNNYAITSAGIGEALERSAASLVAAGNDIDQSIALITAGNIISQDPESVGNAVKVLSLRIRGSKTELQEMGEETDGLASSTSKLREEIKALTGVDIMLNENTYKSTYDILLEISKVWDQIDDVSQANILEKLAGKTRSSVVAGLLQQGETLEKVYKDSMESAGSAEKENERYMESIQGHMDQLTNQWQAMWTNAINRDLINFFVDMGTGALKLVDDIGLINTALMGLAGILTVKQFSKNSGGRAKELCLVA